MTTEPLEPRAVPDPTADSPAADPGVGDPADATGPDGAPGTPPEYPDEVDAADGPLAGRSGGGLGDLRDPGAKR
jgi:hypothetical protein